MTNPKTTANSFAERSQQPNIGGVVFDLDGTLVDSRADILAATNFALMRHGFPPRSEREVVSFIGDGASNLILRATGLEHDPDPTRVMPVLSSFVERYTRFPCVETRLMPGALEALEALDDVPLALLTNKPRPTTEAVLAALGMRERFCCVVAGGDLPVIKPDPRPLLEIAHFLGVTTASLVMVGDGPQDVECGRRAGAHTVGVRGGIAAQERLTASQPDCLIDSLYDLTEVVRSLNLRRSSADTTSPR
jgi:2-phosphoglycolate phosphatase